MQRSFRHPTCFKLLRWRNKLFQNSFLLFTITELNKLDLNIRNFESYSLFCKNLLILQGQLFQIVENGICRICDPLGMYLLNIFRLGLSHLCEHKFRNDSADNGNPLCLYSV